MFDSSTRLLERLEQRICFSTWYIAPYGSDVNSGSINQPLASLAAAAQVARSGDVVYARAGVYQPTSTQVLLSIGAADGHITFESYPGETAVIDGADLPSGAAAIDISGPYIDFEKFEVRNAPGADLQVTGHHVQVIGNALHDSHKQGLLIGDGSSLSATHDVFVQDNFVYNNDLSYAAGAVPAPGSLPIAAAQTDGAANVSFSGNYIHDNHGIGLDLLLVAGGDVGSNVIHDNLGAEVAIDNASQTTVESNFIYNTSEAQFYTAGAPADSVRLSNNVYALSNSLDAIRIQNNIMLFGSSNLLYTNQAVQLDGTVAIDALGLKDAVFANNVFYDAAGPTPVNVSIDDSTGHQNNLVADNIFYQATGTQAALGAALSSGFVFENNNWYQGPASTTAHGGAGSAAGTGDVYDDPRFGNAGAIDPAGYKLNEISPDINAGVSIPGIVNDYYGIPRPEGAKPDIGAHEYLQGAPPPPTVVIPVTTPPGVPGGLAATFPSPYSINLVWGDRLSNITGFDIQRQANGTWITLGFAGVGPAYGQAAVTGTFSDSGLRAHHRYKYRIFAFFTDSTVSGFSRSLTVRTPRAPRLPKARKGRKNHYIATE